jgi:putative methanogenesis marker protein 8
VATYKHSCAVGTHEFQCCGARVRIKDGEIEVLTEPCIKHCPLHETLYKVEGEITRETVRQSVETKMTKYGFCCRHRVFDDAVVVPYGSSEAIMACLEQHLLDASVTVCDGAGTVITANPKLVQAIGAHMTGLVRTSPIKEVIDYVESHEGIVFDRENAEINQVKGVELAAKRGFKHVAVTVASFQAEAISRIRKLEQSLGIEIAIFSVCNTCAQEKDVKHLLKADIACASASKILREKVAPKALMQIGIAIPVFALTQLGKRLILAYLANFGDRLVIFRNSKLPYLVEGRGPQLKS